MGEIVFVDGQYVPYDQAVTHIEDRGNVFADGIYEVIRFYGGRPFEMDAHLHRLEQSAQEIRLTLPMELHQFAAIGTELVARNSLQEASLYIQVTRGIAPRRHEFPHDVRPTVFMVAREVHAIADDVRQSGVVCVSLEDRRWKMCHVKSLALLANVLAKQEAKEAGAFEAILVRDGIVTEGTSSNVFAVRGRRLLTHPEGPFILSGITRRVVLQMAERLRIPVSLEPFTLSELKEADEVFLTGTITEILPVVRVDGKPVGRGTRGPITTDLQEAYDQLKARV